MACATVPKIVLTLNHASGAGYYAMAGQGFDPHFTFSWPTARIGVMEGDSAVQAVYGPELAKYQDQPVPEELQTAVEKTRADYERWLDATYAAARGHVDAIIDPADNPPEFGSVEDLTQWYNDALARRIRQQPDQYWWLHDRWKEVPAAKRRKRKPTPPLPTDMVQRPVKWTPGSMTTLNAATSPSTRAARWCAEPCPRPTRRSPCSWTGSLTGTPTWS